MLGSMRILSPIMHSEAVKPISMLRTFRVLIQNATKIRFKLMPLRTKNVNSKLKVWFRELFILRMVTLSVRLLTVKFTSRLIKLGGSS